MNVDLRQIGIVRSVNEKGEGIVEVFSEYAEGLEGIEDFSHIILIAWLHKVTEEQRKTLKVKPMRIQHLPEVGVFCTHSPHRPNPIALSIVRLVKRKGNLLHVQDLDLFVETPILDIKPVSLSFCPKDIKVPEWDKELQKYKK